MDLRWQHYATNDHRRWGCRSCLNDGWCSRATHCWSRKCTTEKHGRCAESAGDCPRQCDWKDGKGHSKKPSWHQRPQPPNWCIHVLRADRCRQNISCKEARWIYVWFGWCPDSCGHEWIFRKFQYFTTRWCTSRIRRLWRRRTAHWKGAQTSLLYHFAWRDWESSWKHLQHATPSARWRASDGW